MNKKLLTDMAVILGTILVVVVMAAVSPIAGAFAITAWGAMLCSIIFVRDYTAHKKEMIKTDPVTRMVTLADKAAGHIRSADHLLYEAIKSARRIPHEERAKHDRPSTVLYCSSNSMMVAVQEFLNTMAEKIPHVNSPLATPLPRTRCEIETANFVLAAKQMEEFSVKSKIEDMAKADDEPQVDQLALLTAIIENRADWLLDKIPGDPQPKEVK